MSEEVTNLQVIDEQWSLFMVTSKQGNTYNVTMTEGGALLGTSFWHQLFSYVFFPHRKGYLNGQLNAIRELPRYAEWVTPTLWLSAYSRLDVNVHVELTNALTSRRRFRFSDKSAWSLSDRKNLNAIVQANTGIPGGLIARILHIIPHLDLYEPLTIGMNVIGCVFCSPDPTTALDVLVSPAIQMNEEQLAEFLDSWKSFSYFSSNFAQKGIQQRLPNLIRFMFKHDLYYTDKDVDIKEKSTMFQAMAEHFPNELATIVANKYLVLASDLFEDPKALIGVVIPYIYAEQILDLTLDSTLITAIHNQGKTLEDIVMLHAMSDTSSCSFNEEAIRRCIDSERLSTKTLERALLLTIPKGSEELSTLILHAKGFKHSINLMHRVFKRYKKLTEQDDQIDAYKCLFAIFNALPLNLRQEVSHGSLFDFLTYSQELSLSLKDIFWRVVQLLNETSAHPSTNHIVAAAAQLQPTSDESATQMLTELFSFLFLSHSDDGTMDTQSLPKWHASLYQQLLLQKKK